MDERFETPQPHKSGAERQESGSDIHDQRALAILGYIVPILFFIPLLNEKTKDAPFARFHANQQLLLLITAFAIYALHSFLFMSFLMVGVYVVQLLNLGLLALVIYGAYHAYKGEQTELPLIGQFRIL